MILILTEDKNSGYFLFKHLSELVFPIKVEVENTGYGLKEESAGNGEFDKAVRRLYNAGVLHSGDKVFLAFDNLISYKEKDTRFAINIKSLYQKRDSAAAFLRGKGISCYTSSYICIEQMLLTFKYLLEFVTLPNRKTNDRIEFYRTYRNMFVNDLDTVDLDLLFTHFGNNKRTIEKCFSSLLNSLVSDGDFIGYSFNKSGMGSCWYMDCDKSQEEIMFSLHKNNVDELKYCKHCYAVENIMKGEIGKNRLKFVYENSLFPQQLKELFL